MPKSETLAELDRQAAKYQPPLRTTTAAGHVLPDPTGNKDQDPYQDDQLDNHRNAPRPDPECLYGLVGDVARAGSENTEANPFAIAANFLGYMSAAVGRGPYMAVGNTWHHCRLFTLHVGRSGRGRKGDAVALVSRIDSALRVLDKYAAPQVHRGGLSTREGLVFLVHDGYKEGKQDIEPIHDKRLWVVESEFANILQQGKRDGNTLSPALRDCWDGVSLKPATKSNRLHATDPHVNVSAAITPGELLSLIANRDLTNGFANRFMVIFAERTQIVPFPKSTSQDEVDKLARRVKAVLDHCKAQTFVEKDNMRIELTDTAAALWVKLYRNELNDNSAGDRITALIERRAPMLLRVAMLFALCDLKNEVDVHHIKAALAWVRYSVESIKFVFASAADEVKVAEVNDTAQKILVYLKNVERASRSNLTTNCFNGHVSKVCIDAALDELLSSNPPQIIVDSVPRPKGSPGSPQKFYQIAGAKCAKSAKREYPCGSRADSGKRELSEVCEVSSAEEPDYATLRTLRKGQNGPLTRMDIDTSHISQTSHCDSENCPNDSDALIAESSVEAEL